jgi:hypothetical protein
MTIKNSAHILVQVLVQILVYSLLLMISSHSVYIHRKNLLLIMAYLLQITNLKDLFVLKKFKGLIYYKCKT